MRLFCFLCILFSLVTNLDAQTKRAFTKAGDKAFKNKNYSSALTYYGQALEFDADNVALRYKSGEAARLYQGLDLARMHYQRVLNSDRAERFPLAAFWLATVEKHSGDYEKAQSLFQTYLDGAGKGNALYGERAKKEIENCAWAIEQLKAPHNIKIEQLNKRVNTAYSEFGPFLAGDTLYYSSYRFENFQDNHEPPRRLTKILTSVKGSKGRPLLGGVNGKDKLTAHTTFGAGGKRLYYTVCQYTGEVSIQCQIYFRTLDKRKRWSKPKKLAKTVNLPGFTATHPNIGQHPKTGKELLYFVSDRPEGKGQLDIWYSELDEFGQAKTAINLAKINTSENEITPFYAIAGGTLFFSSDGYRGMGGYDIYQSRWDGGDWQEGTHTGTPLNSSYNDLYYFLNADSTQAYFSSNRLGSFYLEKENKICCNDLYKVDVLPPLPKDLEPPQVAEPVVTVPVIPPQVEVPAPMVEPKPVVIPEPEPVIKPEEPVVVVEPKEPEIILEPKVDPPKLELPTPPVVVPKRLEDFLPVVLYFDNDEPDKQTRRTTTKRTYGNTFKIYYANKLQYLKEYPAPLSGDAQRAATEEIESFFEQKIKKGHDDLQLFSAALLERLKAGEKIEMIIKGFTSPRAITDYNLFLGQRRISSLVNHFTDYQGGIFQSFLQSGQLVLTEKSFGESTAPTGISDDFNDRRNSIYHPKAAQERRVEIIEILWD